MHSRSWCTLLLLVVALAAVQPCVWAQQCAPPLTTVAPTAHGQSPDTKESIKIGANSVAQTFLAPGLGCVRVDSVQLSVRAIDPSGDLVVGIFAVDPVTAQPTAVQLGSSAVIGMFASTTNLSKTAVFTTPIELEGGKMYAIVASQPAWAGGNHEYQLSLWKGNTYSDGMVWNGSNSVWTSMDQRDFEMTITFSCCPVIAVGCAYTQGYWQQRPAVWPVDSLALGTTTYTKEELLQILETNAVKGNGLLSLAHQLIAAKLNVAKGTSPSPVEAITSADDLIGNLIVPPIGTGFLSTDSTSTLVNTLDNFNNGLTGVPHCKD